MISRCEPMLTGTASPPIRSSKPFKSYRAYVIDRRARLRDETSHLPLSQLNDANPQPVLATGLDPCAQDHNARPPVLRP